jgi:ATP-dependent Clp protease ATP-binding subunit ClpX
LRGILERLMLDIMYEVPGSEDILSVKITRPVVMDESKPLIRRKQDKAAA